MGDMLERTVAVIGELREVLGEGRALLTDLRHERKACERVLEQLRTDAVAAADRHLDDEVNDLIRRELDKVVGAIGDQQRKAEQRVIRSFDDIANQLMYGNGQGRGANVLVAAARRASHRQGAGGG